MRNDTRSAFVPRARTAIQTLLILVLVGFNADVSNACVYRGKLAKYNRVVDRWQRNPTPRGERLICKIRCNIDRKFRNVPGKPTPPLPVGLTCPPKGGGGGGRGGGPGGGNGGAGGGAGPVGPPGVGALPGILFMRNHNPVACSFDWTINAAPGNPPGFTVSPTSGSVLLAPSSTSTVPFSATIDGAVSPGARAFFDVDITDGCSGLPLPDDFRRFTVTASSDISITPVTPLVSVADGVPFQVSWAVTNHSASQVTKTFQFLPFPDPLSTDELNDGTLYDVRNIFETGSQPGNTVTLDPDETEKIEWGPLINGQYCDPQMLNCCALEIDGAMVCCVIINDDDGPDHSNDSFTNLVGTPQGGSVRISIDRNGDTFSIQVPTTPSDTIPEILDMLAMKFFIQADIVPGFRFMPIVDDDGFRVMASPETIVTFTTFDNGLDWVRANFLGGNGQTDVLFVNRSVLSFCDDMESGDGNWIHSATQTSLPDDWAIINSPPNNCSGSNIWFSADEAGIKDARLDTLPFTVTAHNTTMRFSHVFDMEPGFDGCVLEASIDGGPFFDLGPNILSGGYNMVISETFMSPIAGRPAWSGQAGPPCEMVEVDVTQFVGSTLVLRFRLACDLSVSGVGWYVDDVKVGQVEGAGDEDRRVVVNVGEPITVSFESAMAGPTSGRYLLWVWPGASEGPAVLLNTNGAFVGLLGNPTPFHGGTPQPIFCVRGDGIPELACTGANEISGPGFTPWSITRSQGLAFPTTLTLQGLVQDTAALSPTFFSVTNGIILETQ